MNNKFNALHIATTVGEAASIATETTVAPTTTHTSTPDWNTHDNVIVSNWLEDIESIFV